MPREPFHDPISEETFSRVVGQRARPRAGEPPTRQARDAMAQMARYRTAAPKGVFRYNSHEEANRDRDTWTIERALACAAESITGPRKPP